MGRKGANVMLDEYVNLGLLLKQLIVVSQGTEMSFSDGQVVVKRRDGVVRTASCPGKGLTLVKLEKAIDLALGWEVTQ